MTAPILFTGGTGTLGRHLLRRLRGAGCAVRVLSRTHHGAEDGIAYVVGDLRTGDGLEPAVAGIGTILHLAGTAKGDDVKTRHLIDAATRIGRPRLIYIFVVGADRVPVESAIDRAAFGYFGAKRAAERVVAESGLPGPPCARHSSTSRCSRCSRRCPRCWRAATSRAS